MNRSLKHTNELELVSQAQQGSEKAFTELYTRYKTHMKSNLTSRLRCQIKAEDMMQVVFMKAFSSINTYKPNFKFSTWLLRIALNSIIDESRKNKLATIDFDQQDEDGNNISMEVRDEELNPQEKAETEQKYAILHEIVENDLNEADKIVVQLFYFQQKSHEEIAEQLEFPVGTVKAKLHRAREIMRNSKRINQLA